MLRLKICGSHLTYPLLPCEWSVSLKKKKPDREKDILLILYLMIANLWSKFEIHRTYRSWVMAICFNNECSETKAWIGCDVWKLKNQFLSIGVIQYWHVGIFVKVM